MAAARGLLAATCVAALTTAWPRTVVAVPQAAEAGAAAVAPGEAERLLEKVEARHARTRTVVANFTQSYRSAALGQQVVEHGKLFIKRPGRLRFDYRQPDKKVFIVAGDGSTLSYVPADAAAVRSRLPEDAPQLKLLLGQGSALDSFTVSEVRLKQPRNPAARTLKLTPKKPIDSMEMAYLEVEPNAGSVERVLVVDQLGNESDLVLERVREGVEIRDDVFDLRLPAGVEVRNAGASVSH